MDFIEKPYDPQQMIEVVQANLAQATQRFAARRRQRGVQLRIAALTPA